MVAQIIKAITDAFTGLLSGVGSGIVGTFETLFVKSGTGETTELTTFAIVGLVFLGVGTAWGIVRWLTRKVGK